VTPQVVDNVRPPAGGWRGRDPRVVVQVAQLLKAVRLIEDIHSTTGRELQAAWGTIDPERPDIAAYLRIAAQLEPGEDDYRAAFRNLGSVDEP
jgi:hypothetical protein